ncbi:MAG: hypothetical protein JXR96_17965 [Deltaproteobacteria bacterium]|nr:hypothetical protein [Deltaproteobacteria bacterium]
MRAYRCLLELGLCLSVAIWIAPACERPEILATGVADETLIASHSSGLISSSSSIRVRFVPAVVEPARVGVPLERSPFEFEPTVEGQAVWKDVHELEFRPTERLRPGQEYKVVLRVAEVLEREDAPERLAFDFKTLKQSFEVRVEGLQAVDAAKIGKQRLTGQLVTADEALPSQVEQVLRAAHEGKPLALRWEHSPDKRIHRFSIEGIVRAEQTTSLELAWDGGPIGVDSRAGREIPVPGLSTFAALSARAVQQAQTYIEIRFSDPLAPKQDLAGLIRVPGAEGIRATVEGNIVRLFSSKPWGQQAEVRVELGLRNALGRKLIKAEVFQVSFEALKPQVRFATRGVIVPGSQGLVLPIEAVNLRAVQVRAMRVYADNLVQFLQVNELDGDKELRRVGRTAWTRTISLDSTPDKLGRWVRYGLDLGPLVKSQPAGLYRLELHFDRRHIVWECPEPEEEGGDLVFQKQTEPAWDENSEQESSSWDSWDTPGGDPWEHYESRHDPCSPGYYRKYDDHDITAARNVLLSQIGLVAKRGNDGSLLVVATDLSTAAPLAGVSLRVLDYQQQVLATGRTDARGMHRCQLASDPKPFVVLAEQRGQRSMLRLDDGSALPLSHFDVSGAEVDRGLKGYLYAERGVWRPGDTLYLTFLLHDPDKRLPPDHPLRLELRNPRGQIVKRVTRTSSFHGFYALPVETSPDAPTGNYLARVHVGGAVFEKTLKIETVMPNRLKIEMGFDQPILRPGEKTRAKLASMWLHGAVAKGLRAEVDVGLRSVPTRFERFADYVFDDPTRRFHPEGDRIFEGQLDAEGKAEFDADIHAEDVAPGMLQADFVTRVFEPGGAASSDRFSRPYSPYARYIGIRLPKGDRTRGMLLTDKQHPVRIVAVDPEGKKGGRGQVELKLYKLKWRWWWEKGADDELADYVGSTSYQPIQQGSVTLADGQAEWKLMVKYPDWGRYLVHARDLESGHSSGRIVYIDWPGWAGRAQKDMPGGASVLSLSVEKPEVTVGEEVALTIPASVRGRALVSLESGSRVLSATWVQSGGGQPIQHRFRATADMAPNIYVHVSLLQPHQHKGNDLPMRLYGVLPVRVVAPGTRLSPRIEVADELVPGEIARIGVSEQAGRAMTYTLAIVDEGLLGLTRFATPDPWDAFFSREALGVKTWDLFDLVAGAYGGELERMLAIGGDGHEVDEGGRKKRAERFPPVVRFLGPFALAAGQRKTHTVDIPNYVGQVRVMLVAGQDGAFGKADKSVFVRKPLMVLGTLPRVLGPEEDVTIPVAVFATDAKIGQVEVSVECSGPLTVVGARKKKIGFKGPGDEMVDFGLHVEPELGVGSVVIRAAGGGQQAVQRIEIDVRMPSLRVSESLGAALEPGKTWKPDFQPVGIQGTRKAVLEVSRVPPLNLGKRLDFLIHYPHGCVEQTTSAAFPQIYLSKLLRLEPKRAAEVEKNVRAAISKLAGFQTGDGGFAYWPGGARADDWSTTYAGHFLIEARQAGFLVPDGLLEQWRRYQRRASSGWVAGHERAELRQAYRLYALALAGAPELGAMNRLKERDRLPAAARWRLAAAYKLAGQTETARSLAEGLDVGVADYRELGGTYGSALRDEAMILDALLLLGDLKRAEPVAERISAALSDGKWMSTQTTAQALVAMARLAGVTASGGQMRFEYAWGGAKSVASSSDKPLVQVELDADGKPALSLVNTGQSVVFARLVLSGVPAIGAEKSSQQGLKLELAFSDLEGKDLDVDALDHGSSFRARITVTHTGSSGRYEELALSMLGASGWEIRNQRLDAVSMKAESAFEYRDVRDDRVLVYFDLAPGESRTFATQLNASYLGKYYLPMCNVEAMYDATIHARESGRWVRVVRPGA